MVVPEDCSCTWPAAIVMGSEQVNGVFKENGIFKLPKANFHISIYCILFAKLQKPNSASCLPSINIQKTVYLKQCETEEVPLNMTLTHQPQRLHFRFCVTACDCSCI